jgi:tetratricopeptide (TPR) repeat protein
VSSAVKNPDDDRYRPRGDGPLLRGNSHDAQGRLAAALEQYQAIIDRLAGTYERERFGLSGLPYSSACALAAQVLIELGDLDRAGKLIDEGERVAAAANHLYSRAPVAVARGHLLLQTASPADVARAMEPVVAQPTVGVRTLGDAYRRAGQLDEAEATARTACDFATRQGERGQEARIESLLGEIAGDRRRPDEARAHLSRTKILAGKLGMRRLAAHIEQQLRTLQ